MPALPSPLAPRPSPLASLLLAILALLLCSGALLADDRLAESRRRIENMTAAEKEQLAKWQERFESLAPEKRQQMRTLHDQLQNDAQSEQLRQVMQRYCQWLKTLPAYTQDDLLDLPPDQRVKRIKELRQQQAKSGASQPNPEDVNGLLRWLVRYAARHEETLLRTLAAPQREQLAKLPLAMRQSRLTWLLWQRLQNEPGRSLALADDDLSELRSLLSEDSRKRLEAAQSPEEQRRIVDGLIRRAVHYPSANRDLRTTFLPIQEELLLEFFERGLDDAQRDRLLALPGEEMQDELRKMYWAQFKGPGPPGRRWEGGKHRGDGPGRGKPGPPGPTPPYPGPLPPPGPPRAQERPPGPPEQNSP